MGQGRNLKKILKYFKLKENENTAYQNLWNVAEAVARGKFIVLNSYIRKEEEYKINKLNFHLRKLEKEQLNTK